MEKLDIRNIVKAIHKTVESHKLAKEGEYARWLWQNEKGNRELGINEYGCADAMNILYTIGEFACTPEVRKARLDALRSLQNKETGMFTEATHHTIHTTAHCAAAIELFDAKPLYPLYGLHQYLSKEGLYGLLESQDWLNNPWSESHKGAGVYAALVNAGEATPEFCENYFTWFAENADPVTGFWRKGDSDKAEYSSKWDRTVKEPMSRGPIYTYMAGAFHYLFNHEYAKMPIMYPEKMIDSCIKMYDENALPASFGKCIGFLEIDWIYCLSRAMRQTAYRYAEGKARIEDFAVKLIDYLNGLDYETHDGFNDLHALFGTVCALAELQQFLPGKIVTDKPLKLVLDRRPFI